MKGIVKWFSRDKKFGFICSPEQSGDIFVHENDIKEDGKVLIDGQHVQFDVDFGPRGPKAKNVTVSPNEE